MSDYVRERLRKIQEETVEAARHAEALSVAAVKLDQCSASRVQVGYVYFIRSGQSLKIGFTSDMKRRLQQLKTGSPDRVYVMAVVPGTLDTEAYFHQMFAGYRSAGEWFRYEGELKRFVSAMPARPLTPDRTGAAYPELREEIRL